MQGDLLTRPFRAIVTSFFVVALVIASLGILPAAPAVAAPIPAEVSILDQGQVGRFDTAIVSVRARCESPWIIQDLEVVVTQAGGTVAGSVSGIFGLTCNRAWQSLNVEMFSSSGEPSEPGPANVDAFFTVLDPVTFDPVDQARDSQIVNLVAAAEVEVSPRGVATGPGSAMLFVRVRCQLPWVVQELAVSLGQGFNGGTAAGDFGLTCDARWHGRVLRITPAPGDFERGPADAAAFFTVLDPIDFDPVDQGQDFRTVNLVGA